ncbi:MAG TPA: four-carbon acid sugar kinase family protein [Terracidiphilus sp.]|nr:four-carbon acid sugar kinase family protein [Terracidiphilus sp.]HEV2487050.1 four-carbon acid sugar kinase family protein [Terracidiphilus sp.]
MKNSQVPGLLYAYYGDDFTGSTDVLEALGLNGVPAVLFTHPPSESELAAFPNCRAIGIAGESRSRDPEWMTKNLPRVYARMRELGAPVNHYKVCSTFDSAPQVGSIGRAMELGRTAFKAEYVPVMVGAPHLGRSVVFGNLFAAEDGVVYRIDRHPSMREHPVTAMSEADLRLHLSRQTRMKMGLVDMSSFQSGRAGQRLQSELAGGAKAIVFDGCEDAMLEETARLLWERAIERPVFAVGSSGLTYGLLGHWRRKGLIGTVPQARRPDAADRVLVLSGSCSPVTARQIQRARQQEFAVLHLKGHEPWGLETRKALEALSRGHSVVLYTALGPQPMDGEHGEAFSTALGDRLRELLLVSGVRRIVVAGGDTSTHAVKQLGLAALTFAAPLSPGAPLCLGHAPGSPLDGLELVLKGGQIGSETFFSQVREGRTSQP